MSLTLTPSELHELTGRRHRDAQRAELDHMGIPYFVRRDGSIAVLRALVEQRPAGVQAPRGNIAAAEPELLP